MHDDLRNTQQQIARHEEENIYSKRMAMVALGSSGEDPSAFRSHTRRHHSRTTRTNPEYNHQAVN